MVGAWRDGCLQPIDEKAKGKKPNELAYLAALMKMAGMTANDIDPV